MSLAHKIIRIECVKNQFIENVESLYRIFYNSRKPFIYLLHTIKYFYSKKKGQYVITHNKAFDTHSMTNDC